MTQSPLDHGLTSGAHRRSTRRNVYRACLTLGLMLAFACALFVGNRVQHAGEQPPALSFQQIKSQALSDASVNAQTASTHAFYRVDTKRGFRSQTCYDDLVPI